MQLIVIGILVLLSAYLLVRLILQKREVRNISEQIDVICSDSSRKKIDLLLIDRDLNDLAAKFNRYMAHCENQQIGTHVQDRKLKEAVSNLSHDLRTPLTSMIGYLQLIAVDDLSEEQKRRIDIVASKSNQMKELVEAFFELSLLESDETKPGWERINLTNLMSDLVAEYVPRIEAAGFALSINIPGQPVFVIADRNMLIRVISNLLDNALRHGKISLTVTLDTQDTSCRITVSNGISTMPGIDVDRIFDRFYTTAPERGTGSGLGLPIVKLLMERMGGSVEASIEQSELSIVCRIQQSITPPESIR